MRLAGMDSSAAKGHEVLVDTEPVGTALLGMELRPITLRRAAAAAGDWSVDAMAWRDASGVYECTK